MYLHVRLKISSLVKCAIAYGALVRCFFEMRHFMDSERARLTKSLATIVALEWLLFGMNVAMITQMILSTKGLSTNVTRVGTLVSVRSLVNQQVVGFGKLTIAIFADKLFLWTSSCGSGDF